MEYDVDSSIVIIRGSNDILNPAYLSPISDGKCSFQSVDHYYQVQTLLRAGLVAEAEEISQVPNPKNRQKFVRSLITSRVYQGDVDRANRLLADMKDEHLRIGLRLRFDQDYSFRRALMDTGRALLTHCDTEDFQYGLGMDERSFLNWVDSNGMKTEVLLDWFRRYDVCPCQDIVGKNKLGLMLMEIRAEEFERLRHSSSPSLPPTTGLPPAAPPRFGKLPSLLAPFGAAGLAANPGLPSSVLPISGIPHHPLHGDLLIPPRPLTQDEIDESLHKRYVIPGMDEGDDDGDWVVSDQVLALEGPLAVLSQYYPTPLVTRKRRYRSVEHYAYQKLFRKLKLTRKALEKLVTTPDPSKLSGLAKRLLFEFWSGKGGSSGGGGDQTKDGTESVKGEIDATKSKNEQRLAEQIQFDTNFYDRLLIYYERATNLKFEQYPVLRRLLVATGDALLIETCLTTDRKAASEWAMCIEESDVQRFLVASPYNVRDFLRFILKPEKEFYRFFAGMVGRNRAGLALMRLRRQYKMANVELLHFPPPPPTGGELDESLICFSNTSVFHPSYIAPFWTKEGDVYASVQHFVCLEAAKKFGFSDSVQKRLANCDAGQVDQWLSWFIYQRFPDPEPYLEWFWSGGREEVFKLGCRLKFEKHPDLLRALLETGNSLLVYCRGQFRSEDTEWSVGMTDYDLKLWMQESRCDCRTLLKWCLSPLERRPAFLGGNRLGALLMELRREFRLRGFQPHTLPKLGMSTEMVIGSGSESGDEENFDADGWTETIWPSPHVLLNKKRGLPILDRPSKKRRLMEHVLTPAAATSSAQSSPAALVAAMDVDTLKESASKLLSKIKQMREATDSENGVLGQLLVDLSEIRDRNPAIDASVHETSSESITTTSKTPEQPSQTAAAAPSVSDQKEKWHAFESGLLSILRKSITQSEKKEKMEPFDNDESLFIPKNWDEGWVRPLVDRVWPHLTLRERRTASEWLWYTIGKLETMRRQRHEEKLEVARKSGKAEFFVPTENPKPKWVMPQMKVVMTQKVSEPSEARAATPQGEGTVIDAIKYLVDWVMPEAGAFPKVLAPLSP